MTQLITLVGYHCADYTSHNPGLFAITQPDFITSTPGYTLRNRGFDMKADYIFKKGTGLLIGLQSDYGTDQVRFDQTGESKKHRGINLGVRTGYRLMFGKKENAYKGLYLVPWIALIYTPDSPVLQFQHAPYESDSWFVFPTVHLGYRF